MSSMARRMLEVVEPIGANPYSADESKRAMFALGFTNCWDTYFAGRAAPTWWGPSGNMLTRDETEFDTQSAAADAEV